MKKDFSFAKSLRERVVSKQPRMLSIPDTPEFLGKTIAEIRKQLEPISLPDKYRPIVEGEEVGEEHVFRGGKLYFEFNPNKK